MIISQAIEILKRRLGEEDITDEAIDIAITVMEKYEESIK